MLSGVFHHTNIDSSRGVEVGPQPWEVRRKGCKHPLGSAVRAVMVLVAWRPCGVAEWDVHGPTCGPFCLSACPLVMS